MNHIRLGLFRVWAVASLIWISVSIWWLFGLTCAFGLLARCYPEPSSTVINPRAYYVDPVPQLTHLVDIAVKAFGPPVATLLVGAAVLWALSGFKPERGPK
jgi:hypothetical protein